MPNPFGIRYNQSFKKYDRPSKNSGDRQPLKEFVNPTFFEDQRLGFEPMTAITRKIEGTFEMAADIEQRKFGPKVNIQPEKLLKLLDKSYTYTSKVPVRRSDGTIATTSDGDVIYQHDLKTTSLRSVLDQGFNSLLSVAKDLSGFKIETSRNSLFTKAMLSKLLESVGGISGDLTGIINNIDDDNLRQQLQSEQMGLDYILAEIKLLNQEYREERNFLNSTTTNQPGTYRTRAVAGLRSGPLMQPPGTPQTTLVKGTPTTGTTGTNPLLGTPILPQTKGTIVFSPKKAPTDVNFQRNMIQNNVIPVLTQMSMDLGDQFDHANDLLVQSRNDVSNDKSGDPDKASKLQDNLDVMSKATKKILDEKNITMTKLNQVRNVLDNINKTNKPIPVATFNQIMNYSSVNTTSIQKDFDTAIGNLTVLLGHSAMGLMSTGRGSTFRGAFGYSAMSAVSPRGTMIGSPSGLSPITKKIDFGNLTEQKVNQEEKLSSDLIDIMDDIVIPKNGTLKNSGVSSFDLVTDNAILGLVVNNKNVGKKFKNVESITDSDIRGIYGNDKAAFDFIIARLIQIGRVDQNSKSRKSFKVDKNAVFRQVYSGSHFFRFTSDGSINYSRVQ